MRRTLLALAVVLVILVGAGVYLVRKYSHRLPVAAGSECAVATDTGTVHLHADQMANAATIAAVGLTRDIPDRGIVVALATALQESELQNLAGGDRDSVGLFQQRPSQGWGSVAEIRDPRYAAGAFYDHLVRIPGWEELRITEAAQAVQRSAYPEAYQDWAVEAQILGEALVGQAAGAVACGKVGEPSLRGSAASQALGAGLRLDWGVIDTVSDGGDLMVVAGPDRSGWQYAHWLVAHSADHNVARVRFGNQEWTADSAEWKQVDSDPAQANLVVAAVYG